MNRRELIFGSFAASGLTCLTTGLAFAEEGDTQPPPKSKKKIPPTFVPEVPKIISRCGREIPALCRKIQRDMNAITKVYRAMIADAERRLKAGGLDKTAERNLKGMLKFLRRKNNEMTENATGKSASYIRAANKKAGLSFCEKAALFLRKAAGNSSDYRKRGRTNRQRVQDIKDARKNLRAATRIISQATSTAVRKARSGESALSRTRKAKGTSGIYSAKRQAAIDIAVRKLMNASGLIFDANDKERELQTISFRIYGKA